MLDQFIALLVLLIALFGRYILPYLIEWQRAEEERAAGQPPASSLPLPLPPVPAPSMPEGPPIPVRTRPAPALRVQATPIARRHQWLRQLHREEARRGMVLMIILGPCRALEGLREPQ